MTADLVERGEALAALDAALRAVAAEARGRIALVAGEAGIGKTSLLRAFAAAHPAAPLWWGGCDALQTPHPLAPLHDIARDADVRFGALLRDGGSRPALFDAVLDELRRAGAPRLVVIEDAHWADDATLDLIRFVGRRIERTKALLALSFRDDEVPAAHPLRRVIGELPSPAVTRLALQRLSPAAVTTLARRAGRLPAGVHAATQGNPFFVTELLRAPDEHLPPSVQALVLARYARLPGPAQAVVRLASIVPARIEHWLVDALLAPAPADIEACLDSGLLHDEAGALAFRHELARVAVESSLPPAVVQALHAQALRALAQAPADAAPSPARLVHHAALARDGAAVRCLAPVAAQQAQQRGAHRAAAAQWRLALEHAGTPPAPELAQWLEAYATECQLTDQLDAAIDARTRLGALYRAQGRPRQEADNESRIALVHVLALRNAEADAASRRAIGQLEALAPGLELARAYRVQAQLRMLNRDCRDSTAWSRKAIALAEPLGDRELLASGYGTFGAALLFIDWDAGVAELQRALDIALADGLHWIAANSYVNVGSAAGELMRLDAAETWLRRAIDFASEHEIDFYLNYARAWLALVHLGRGRWSEAAELAAYATARAGAMTTSRVMALIALGRVRARRGDPGTAEVLDPALELAERSGTLQRLGPVRAARAEAAFLRGDLARATEEARAALALAVEHEHPWFSGELAYWLWRCGRAEAVPVPAAAPYALQMDGRWRDAAAAWQALGCPYERARALAEGDEAAQRMALTLFDDLGARPAAEALRARLQAAGVRGLARGPRASTREQPFGLTARELQTLQLLCEGLRNAEIAARLHRSVRTVDHHLEAVFAKLGVDSRAAAIAAAQRAGLAPQSGQARVAN
ncbi:MAG TPA: AAA family ATPase [Burkholderiaceae bacterium]|nr:AAA family ATPase [Burkholderiaceae bacterium]